VAFAIPPVGYERFPPVGTGTIREDDPTIIRGVRYPRQLGFPPVGKYLYIPVIRGINSGVTPPGFIRKINSDNIVCSTLTLLTHLLDIDIKYSVMLRYQSYRLKMYNLREVEFRQRTIIGIPKDCLQPRIGGAH
jgi:hypothetical protein